MKSNFWIILILYCLIQTSFQACKNEAKVAVEEEEKPVAEVTHTTFDTNIIVNHWKGIAKDLEGIDSISAWKFIWENDILVNIFHDFRSCRAVKIIKKDLTKNGVDDFFITINNSSSFLYQRNEKQQWKQIWEGYEDGGGAPELVYRFGNWVIKSLHFMCCSNCSNDGLSYTKVNEGAVIDVFTLAWGYNYDHERTKSTYCLYEECGGVIDLIVGNQLIVKYEIVFSELESHLTFLQDTTVRITYEWIRDSLLMKEVAPAALKPYIIKWHKKLEEERESYGYHLNGEVLLGYMDFKKEALLKLKKNKKYKETIKHLEITYEKSWEELIENWSTEYSFGRSL